METRVLTVDPSAPDREAIREGAAVVRRGRLVAFPTETVYGLGANALDPAAVSRIFAAKGRPATNPIIVHILDADAARSLVVAWPERAERLSNRFWPGPLTFVLPRSEAIPAEVTAGGFTVAIRAPSHPVARALLEEAKLPIAAPSANRSSRISPTQASHVLKDLNGDIDLVLDGGSCPGGIESTVLDLTTDPPTMLRPGLITSAAIEAVIGPIRLATRPIGAEMAKSPGMLERHYAPEASVEMAQGSGSERVHALARAGLRVGWISQRAHQPDSDPWWGQVEHIQMQYDSEGYASRLYEALHRLDEAKVDRIVVDALPSAPDWLAIRDRLRRASAAASVDE